MPDRARLTGRHGTGAASLNAEADALFRRYTSDHEETSGELEKPPRAQLLAEALVSLCRKGTAVDVDAPAPWCDAHHLHRWEDGGSTDLSNLVDRWYHPSPGDWCDSRKQVSALVPPVALCDGPRAFVSVGRVRPSTLDTGQWSDLSAAG